MADYIFLDTSILLYFSKTPEIDLLSQYISKNNLTVLLNDYSFIELCNSKHHIASSDQAQRICSFLAMHSLYIAETEKTWKMSIFSLPNQDYTTPEAFIPLEGLSSEEVYRSLYGLLMAEDWWIDQNPDLDIRFLSRRYRNPRKRSFRNFVSDEYRLFASLKNRSVKEKLILDCWSIAEQALTRDFLFSLLKSKKLTQVDLLTALPLHCIALADWYAYSKTDKGYTHKLNESDCADIIHLSLIPFCKLFVTEKAMGRIAQKIVNELDLSTEILNHADLRSVISCD